MSASSEISVTCDVCGTTQTVTTWDAVNATVNPDLKARLLDGELNKFVCGTCGWSTGIVYPMLYHDMPSRLMVWLQPSSANPEKVSLPMGSFIAEYTLRLVDSRNDLVEKVLLLDEGLDDRVMEFLKLSLRTAAGGPGGHGGALLFAGPAENQSGQPGFKLLHVEAGEGEPIFVGRAEYEEAAKSLEKTLLPKDAERGRWLRVNQEYAAALAVRL
jgi:hypothetical protein